MRFQILGPIVMDDGDGPAPLGAGHQKALLALLLLRGGEPLPVERIVDELWGEAPPPTAAKAVQNHVSALRRTLGDSLVTEAGGYALRVAPGELDAEGFEARAAAGREALARGDAELAAAELRA